MAEDWRRKAYYDPRVLIETERILAPQFGDSLLCITGAQLEMLRNLVGYLHRRSTFVSEYHTDYYLCADTDDWDAIQAEVAELEDTLMGCEEITQKLEDIAGQLRCLCALAHQREQDGVSLGPIVDGYLGDGTLKPEDDYGGTVPAGGERCALAQLTYWDAWYVVANLIAPLDELALDFLLPALLGLLGGLVGGPLVGIPAALLIVLIRGLIEMQAAGLLPDVLSVWEDAQEDIICALYEGLATGYRQAETAAMAVIMDLPVISLADKVALHCLVCPWAIMLAKTAYDNETEWALEKVEEGYCLTCDVIEGSDWWAVPVYLPDGDIALDHETPGDYWVDGEVCGIILDATIKGVVVECVELTGCTLELTHDFDTCTGDDLLLDEGYDVHDGDFVYVYEPFSHDEDEAIAALCPGAEKYDKLNDRTGPGNWSLGCHLGWSCTGSALVRVRYIVYGGSPP